MSAIQERIQAIELEMARTQKNKAVSRARPFLNVFQLWTAVVFINKCFWQTLSHICMLKAQLAQLRRQEIENQMKGTGGGGDGWDVKATGDARVGLIGFPSVGKSTLLTKMTGTHSEAAAYEFTVRLVHCR